MSEHGTFTTSETTFCPATLYRRKAELISK